MKDNDPTLHEQINYMAFNCRKALAADVVVLVAADDGDDDKIFTVTGISGHHTTGRDLGIHAATILLMNAQAILDENTDGQVQVLLRTKNGTCLVGHAVESLL